MLTDEELDLAESKIGTQEIPQVYFSSEFIRKLIAQAREAIQLKKELRRQNAALLEKKNPESFQSRW